ncbi:DinB family protein [uncultured Microscilla sp.]|uniref:DinB family protein n=1 Tax=uncultured Microscilla sp. TaxID=432653 RepID=UPI00263339A1|nr:DinB family protein [uncultured Microscilla sp.]
MNTTQQTQKKLNELFSYYIQELDRYTDEQFVYKETESTWSLAQMYQHIYTASTFFVYNINNCLKHKKGSLEGKKTQMGEMLYKHGGFPKQKIKQPKEWTSGAPEAKSRNECKQQWTTLLKQLQGLAAAIADDSDHYKVKHVIFGMLNSLEWYQQIEMHTRHHLHQKKELEAFVNISVNEFAYKSS